MNPRKIIIKTLYPKLNHEFCHILRSYPKIKFFNKKINGTYVTVIKCSNYYNPSSLSDIYGSYIYLYTNISMILSELIIKYFEKNIISRLLNEFYFYFSDAEIRQN